ncbi:MULTISPECIES: hypothetical protein [Aeromonas]|uniref:hypothetical protein n=1 Tax=Aeromonas TaxID=642 RepID=UPI0018E00182|nr:MULTISPECIES: hypothetical protein [Aeromonas]MCX0432628.1 hypothetical protein [Aeromonas veronii]
MEVKTTGSITLTYATALVDDYEKLLGKVAVAGSLGQRFNWLQAYLREVHEFSDVEIERVGNLYMPEAKDCKNIKLLPTLVHDLNAGDKKAVEALDDVATKIEEQGWSKQTIEPWSIAINKLTECLVHLSNNGSSMP